MERDAAYWVDRLHLRRHPEGGYYRVPRILDEP